MKKLVFLLTLFCFPTVAGFSQNLKPAAKPNQVKQPAKPSDKSTEKPPAKSAVKKPAKLLAKAPIKPAVKSELKPAVKPTPIKTLREVPDSDWKILIDAVQSENWQKSSSLADGFLAKIKVENNKKHVARLHYILLYALAGKAAAYSLAGKKPEENQARILLEKTANEFLGKDFFMPSRQISDDCLGKLNYICSAKKDKNVVRTTAAKQDGTAIYSFEYVRLKKDFNLGENVGKQAIVGGTLKKIEFNPNKSNVWIMRLFFENGVINVVPEN